MKRILYTIVFLMTIATYSQKTDWIEIIDTEERTNYLKVRTENTAWIKMVFKNDDLKQDEKVVRQILALMKFDCDKMLLGYVNTIFYDDDLKVIVQESVNEILVKMENIIPDSYMESYYKSFCNKDKKD